MSSTGEASIASRRVVGKVGDRHLLARLGEHPGDVDGDIADADHHRRADVEVRDSRPMKSGWQLYQPTKALEPKTFDLVLARDAEPVVVGRAIGQHDGVIDPLDLADLHVAADLHIADEAHAVGHHRLFEGAGDLLGRLMVRRNPAANQPERRRQAVEHVDAAAGRPVDQPLRDIHAAGSRPHDGNAPRHPALPDLAGAMIVGGPDR